ncbi:MAG: YihY/virulence factor BrkB family protein [Candidatus Methylomirabilales bacterium]
MRGLWRLVKEAYNEWSADNAFRLGASLSYYTVFSIAPLLVLTMTVIGLVFGQEAAQSEVMSQVRGLMGQEVGATVESMVGGSQSRTSGIFASLISLVTLLLGASGVFVELQDSMNVIWDAPARASAGIWAFIKGRLLSFAMVIGIGFLLLVSLVLSAALSAMAEYFTPMLPEPLSGWMLPAVHFAVSLGVIALLFAVMFKVLPDVENRWRDVWPGAIITALLFTVGKFAIGVYLGRSGVASSYGAAASFILLLLWVYYSSLILFFGAELTQVYARRAGAHPAARRPARQAA